MNAVKIKSVIIAAAVLLICSPLLHAVQLGDPFDPFSTGSGQVEAENSENPGKQRQISSGGVMITWSETNDELRGFSQKTGDWEIIRIGPQKEIVPIVSQHVAAVRFGDSIAAFSGIRGWWDVIELSKDSKSQPTVSDSLVKIEDNGHLYTFAAEKGRWTSPTDPELQPVNETIELLFESSGNMNPSNIVYTLNKRFEIWRESLPRYKAREIAFSIDSSIGTGKATARFLTSRQSWMAELKAKLHEICDGPEFAEDSEEKVDAPAQSQQVSNLEQQIATLQVKLNTLRSTTPEVSDATAPQPDKATLRKQVEQDFDVRQQLQELEAQKLRLKLQLIEANLTTRQKNRDGIIERRLEELLTSGIDTSSKQETVGLPGTPPFQIDGLAEVRPFQKDSTQTAATLPANVQDAAAAMTWKQPWEIISELRKAQLAIELRHRHRSKLEEIIRRLSEKKKSETVGTDAYEEIEREIKEVEEEDALTTDAHMDELMRDWNQPWSEYQTYVRLLRLGVEAAKTSLAAIQQNHIKLQQQHRLGYLSINEVQQDELQVQRADIQLRQAEELLKLYTDIETNEPKLNPAYQVPPAETATDAKTE